MIVSGLSRSEAASTAAEATLTPADAQNLSELLLQLAGTSRRRDIYTGRILKGEKPTAIAQGLITEKNIPLALAQTIANAALARCQSMGFKVAVTVVDRGGFAHRHVTR
jgi:hypothetical protein